MSKQLVVQAFPRKSPAFAVIWLGVTEPTNMGESKGTKLKPIPPILFLTSL